MPIKEGAIDDTDDDGDDALERRRCVIVKGRERFYINNAAVCANSKKPSSDIKTKGSKQ
jgi:hypothetical protein